MGSTNAETVRFTMLWFTVLWAPETAYMDESLIVELARKPVNLALIRHQILSVSFHRVNRPSLVAAAQLVQRWADNPLWHPSNQVEGRLLPLICHTEGRYRAT